jgi:hypothetical protein
VGKPERYKMKITHDKLKRIIKEELSLISEDLFDDAVEAGGLSDDELQEDLFDDAVEAGDLNEDRFDDATKSAEQGFDESEVTAILDEAYDNYVKLMDRVEKDMRSMHRYAINKGPENLLGWFNSEAFPAMREGRLPGSPPTGNTPPWGESNYAYVGPIEEDIAIRDFDPMRVLKELRSGFSAAQNTTLRSVVQGWGEGKEYVSEAHGGKGLHYVPIFQVISYENLPTLEGKIMTYSPFGDDNDINYPPEDDILQSMPGRGGEKLTEEGEGLSLESLRKLYDLVKKTSEDNGLGWDV